MPEAPFRSSSEGFTRGAPDPVLVSLFLSSVEHVLIGVSFVMNASAQDVCNIFFEAHWSKLQQTPLSLLLKMHFFMSNMSSSSGLKENALTQQQMHSQPLGCIMSIFRKISLSTTFSHHCKSDQCSACGNPPNTFFFPSGKNKDVWRML